MTLRLEAVIFLRLIYAHFQGGDAPFGLRQLIEQIVQHHRYFLCIAGCNGALNKVRQG